MKLLASDYDGTLYTNILNLGINIDYIKQFRKKGHKFMLTTGRSFNSIKKQIEIFNIPYDYLSCNDGSVLFDNKDNLLFIDYLKVKDVEKLVKEMFDLNIISKLELYGINGKIKTLNDVIEIYCKTNLFESSNSLFEILNEYNLKALKFLNNYYIENKGGKSRSIKFINEKENFDEIITVGDNINDIEMLKDYNGYHMLLSQPSLYFQNIKITTSVKSLIKKHL